MANAKLNKLLMELVRLQDNKDELERQAKLNSKALEELQPKLVAEFDAAGMQSLNLSSYGTFYVEAQTFPKVEDNETLIAWLGRNKLASLVKKSVHYQTLRGLVNERLKVNLPLPEGISTFDKRVVKLRSAETA